MRPQECRQNNRNDPAHGPSCYSAQQHSSQTQLEPNWLWHGQIKGPKDWVLKNWDFKKVHRCDSMQFDKKVHRYRFASNGIESHRIESRPMRFDAIRCESISMNFCIEVHRIASMNFFENPVFQNPVFRTFERGLAAPQTRWVSWDGSVSPDTAKFPGGPSL